MRLKLSKTGFGFASAAGAYAIWGFLPIYWKLLDNIPAPEILAHRILWSCGFLLGIFAVTGKMCSLYAETRAILAQPKKAWGVLAASLIMTVNWLIYIWAVNDGRIVETSLGYYINPLVNVLLGIAVLKERLTFWQTVSVVLAASGVLNLTLNFGAFPWVAIALAVSFALYGLCQKLLNIGGMTSITLETLALLPATAAYLAWLQHNGAAAFTFAHPLTALLLLGCGIVTAIPMVLFTNGALYLPLTVLGFIQFLSPTIALFVGIFLYHEPFSATHLISFGCIWVALLIFSLAQTNAWAAVSSLRRDRKNLLSCASKKAGL